MGGAFIADNIPKIYDTFILSSFLQDFQRSCKVVITRIEKIYGNFILSRFQEFTEGGYGKNNKVHAARSCKIISSFVKNREIGISMLFVKLNWDQK